MWTGTYSITITVLRWFLFFSYGKQVNTKGVLDIKFRTDPEVLKRGFHAFTFSTFWLTWVQSYLFKKKKKKGQPEPPFQPGSVTETIFIFISVNNKREVFAYYVTINWQAKKDIILSLIKLESKPTYQVFWWYHSACFWFLHLFLWQPAKHQLGVSRQKTFPSLTGRNSSDLNVPNHLLNNESIPHFWKKST